MSTERKIQDYLHFYLQCRDQRILKIEKSNHWFVHNRFFHKDDESILIPSLVSEYEIHGKGCIWKLILRPLSDMTEEEAVELAKLSEYEPHFNDVKIEKGKFDNDIIVTWQGISESREQFNATGELFYCAEQFQYLLKNSFDLFNLIPDGLAINKTTLKP